MPADDPQAWRLSAVTDRRYSKIHLPLEHELQRDLHDSRIRGTQDLAEGRAVQVHIRTCDCRRDTLKGGGTVIRVVRHVKHFGSKLQRLLLANGEASCQAHIDPDACRTCNTP